MHSKATVRGRQIHPMIVPFATAGYLGTFAGYLVYAATDAQFWLDYAIVMNVLGVAGAVLAALPGVVDLVTVVPKGTPAERVAVSHAVVNTVALFLFAVTLGVYVTHWHGPARSATLGVTLSALGIAALPAAVALGRSLVRDHHVGVRNGRRGEASWHAGGDSGGDAGWDAEPPQRWAHGGAAPDATGDDTTKRLSSPPYRRTPPF